MLIAALISSKLLCDDYDDTCNIRYDDKYKIRYAKLCDMLISYCANILY
jgi:hypothetical protein